MGQKNNKYKTNSTKYKINSNKYKANSSKYKTNSNKYKTNSNTHKTNSKKYMTNSNKYKINILTCLGPIPWSILVYKFYGSSKVSCFCNFQIKQLSELLGSSL